MPFYMVDDQAWQITAWTNIYLGGLIGSSQASRLFFTLSQRAPKETWESGSLPRPVNRRLALPFIYNQVYKRGITLATRYNPSWHAAHITQQPDHNGLDVQQVYEVTVGARDIDHAHDCWKALLDPHPEIAPGDLAAARRNAPAAGKIRAGWTASNDLAGRLTQPGCSVSQPPPDAG